MRGVPRTAWVVVMMLLVAACGAAATEIAATTEGSDGTVVSSELARVLDPGVGDDAIARLVAGDTEFAFDLFAEVAADGGNVVLSPYSIAVALTMTYAGARGNTATEMRRALVLGLPDEQVHEARNALDLQLTTNPDPVPSGQAEPFTLRPANSLWGQVGGPFLDEFLDLLARDYGAAMHLVDFAQTDVARATINGWVKDETEGRIGELLGESDLDDSARLVLVNAVRFEAGWLAPFDPDETREGTFTLPDGNETTVPMMRGTDQYAALAEGDGYLALDLPYGGGASMLLVVPDEGRFAEVVERLGPEDLAGMDLTRRTTQVAVTMPRFEIESAFDLKTALQGLGMEEAFQDPSMGGADFSGMTAAKDLSVGAVVHQAAVDVDEAGTEAAAATVVVMTFVSASDPLPIVVDRPFLFFVRHDPTGEILFMGQVTDPR